MRLQEGLQMDGLCWVIVDYSIVIEFDAGLHHHGDHTLPGSIHTCVVKCLAMNCERPLGRLGCSYFKGVQCVSRSAGNGNLSRDNVDERRERQALTLGFGCAAEQCGPLCHHFIGDDCGIVRAAHAGVQVDFCKSGCGICADHLDSAVHRSLCVEVLPGIGAKVVSAKDETRTIEAALFCNG